MKLLNKIILLPAALQLLVTNLLYCQIRPDIKEILEEFGNNAKAYFLSANRPSYGVNAYTTPKHKFELDISASGNNEIFDIPVSISYGLGKNTEIFTGISLYTKTYNFSGSRINGVGDANIGIKYKFQESRYFSHAVQMLAKIPTASRKTGLGTGYIDFHFGVAEGFYHKPWGYDVSVEINFLKRRDFPVSTREEPIVLKESIDSIKSIYNYKYETEVAASLGPSFDITGKFGIFAGFSFSRNFKLDFNSSEIYTGLGYVLTDKMGIGLGASFGIKNASKWILSAGVNFEFD